MNRVCLIILRCGLVCRSFFRACGEDDVNNQREERRLVLVRGHGTKKVCRHFMLAGRTQTHRPRVFPCWHRVHPLRRRNYVWAHHEPTVFALAAFLGYVVVGAMPLSVAFRVCRVAFNRQGVCGGIVRVHALLELPGVGDIFLEPRLVARVERVHVASRAVTLFRGIVNLVEVRVRRVCSFVAVRVLVMLRTRRRRGVEEIKEEEEDKRRRTRGRGGGDISSDMIQFVCGCAG